MLYKSASLRVIEVGQMIPGETGRGGRDMKPDRARTKVGQGVGGWRRSLALHSIAVCAILAAVQFAQVTAMAMTIESVTSDQQHIELQRVNIFDVDDRIPLSALGAEARRYAPIGVIENLTEIENLQGERHIGVKGTVFLISPCYAVMNYHVAFGANRKDNLDYRSRVSFQRDESVFLSEATAVMGGFYRRGPGAGDWALLKLDNCIGSILGWMETATFGVDELPSLDVMLVGFYSDRDPFPLLVDPACKITSVSTQIGVSHTCASRPGSSGAPLMALDTDGTPYVVGINAGPWSGANDIIAYTDENANRGVSMIEILSSFAGRSADLDKRKVPGGNPALLREEVSSAAPPRNWQ